MPSTKTPVWLAILWYGIAVLTGAHGNAAPAVSVVAWDQPLLLPAVQPGTQFTRISAGWKHSLALKNDGTVVAWGDNGSGQSTVPSSLSGVEAIAAGNSHSLALKSDVTVIAWGDNRFGQSTVPSGLGGVMAIAAGYSYSLALVSIRPALSSQRSAARITLSWPTWPEGFHLESSTNLADPNGWRPVTDTSVIVGFENVLTNSLSGAARFFRLKQ